GGVSCPENTLGTRLLGNRSLGNEIAGLEIRDVFGGRFAPEQRIPMRLERETANHIAVPARLLRRMVVNLSKLRRRQCDQCFGQRERAFEVLELFTVTQGKLEEGFLPNKLERVVKSAFESIER